MLFKLAHDNSHPVEQNGEESWCSQGWVAIIINLIKSLRKHALTRRQVQLPMAFVILL